MLSVLSSNLPFVALQVTNSDLSLDLLPNFALTLTQEMLPHCQ